MFSSLHQSPPLGETGIPALISWKRYNASVFANRKKKIQGIFLGLFSFPNPVLETLVTGFMPCFHLTISISASKAHQTLQLCAIQELRWPRPRRQQPRVDPRTFADLREKLIDSSNFLMRIAHELICIVLECTHTPFKTPSLLSLQRNGAKKIHEDKWFQETNCYVLPHFTVESFQC